MVLLLALLIVGKAQTPLLSEDFNNDFPTDWTSIDADGDGHEWAIIDMDGHGGDGDVCITSQSYTSSDGALDPDNWLITPAVQIPSGGVYDLTFWVCAQDASYPNEHYGLYITTSNDYQDPANYDLIFEETIDANGGTRTQGAWKMKSYSLASYAGQTIHIAFRHFDCRDEFYLNLDDVTIDVASTDPSVTINTSMIRFSGGTVGSNFGRQNFAVTAINLTQNVTLTMPAGTPFGISTDTVNYSNNITLTPNASGNASCVIYVNFNPTTVGYFESVITITSEVGTETVTLEGLTIDCSQSQTIPWYETFTTEDFPANCWTMTSTDTADYVQDGQVYPGYKYYTWFNSINSQYASVRGDEEGVQDEHLYSPTFSLSNVTGAADFQFDFRTNPNVEALINGEVRFTINMSTDGGNTYTPIWNVADIRADFSEYWSSWSDIWPVKFNMDQYIGTNALIKFDFHYEADLGAADQVIIQAVKFTNYQDPRMAVNADDTLDFFTYVGNPETFIIPVEGRNLSESINVNTTAPFEVSIDGNTYLTTATLPATGGNLYVRYNPNNNSSNIENLVIGCNYTDATHTYPDTTFNFSIVLRGNSYDCSVIDLPISESFESEDGSVLAPNATEYCWSAIKGNPADAQNAIINSNDYAYVGSQSFRFSSTNYNAQQIYDQYLISPELNAENPMMVMFNYANASTLKDETFCVGYSTTTNDINAFTWEADIVNSANTEWQLYRNINVPADVKYVAVHYKSPRMAFLYIDNFQIMETPSCIFPVEVRAESTGTNYADITWEAGDNEQSWQIVYGVAPLDLTTAVPQTVNAIGTTLNNLTANTHYQVALRAICGSTYSDWSEIADFWTTTTPATIPYNQTFEDNDPDRNNWVLVNGNEPNYFAYGNIPASTSGKALMITKNGIDNNYLTDEETSSYSTVWAYRDIQFPSTSEAAFVLTLKWKCFGEVDYDFGELFIGNATEVTNFERDEHIPGYIDVNSAHYTPAGLTKLARFVGKSTFQSGAYLIPSEGIAGTVKRLYFLWTNDSLSGKETPLAIDNINISIPQFSNLSGTVIDANTQAPIAGAHIYLESDEGFTATATSDNNGQYTINDVVATYYNITVKATGYQVLNTGYYLQAGDNSYTLELVIEDCAIIPTGVNYTIEEDNLILTWDSHDDIVISQAPNVTATYITGATNSGISYNFGCFHLFNPSDLIAVNGSKIVSFSTWVYGDPTYCDYSIAFFVGGNLEEGPASSQPVYEQAIAPENIITSGWMTIPLDEPFVIDGTQTLWIGYKGAAHDTPDEYRPILLSANVTNPGFSDILLWGTEFEAYGKDMFIKATVQAPDLTYSVLADGISIASDLEETEYVISPYDPTACYQVTTTCENGQVSSPSDCATEVGINDVNVSNSFEVYPNPAHETVTVSTTMNAQKVEVLNYLGQVIYSQSVSSNNFTLNVANYADGVYFIRISGNDGIATQKLIKK